MKLVKLGELASIQTGKIDVNKAVVGGKYPFFTCSREAYEINDAPFEGKAVLVAGNGDLNVKYYEGKFNAYQRTYFLFVKNENELIPRYLYWFLESYVGKLRSESIGSTIKYIKMGNLTEAEIPLLPLEMQRKIVEKLDSAFTEIDLLEGNLGLSDEKVSQLLQSLLSAAFTASGDGLGVRKPTANHPLAKDLVKLGEICKLVGGGTPSKANSDFYLGEIPWATVRDLRNRWLGNTEHKINPTAVRESSTNVIPAGNVVLASRVGLGKVVQLKQDTAINQDLRALIPKEKANIDSNYLYYWTLSIAPQIIAAGKGATVQGVTLPFLENLEIPLPSLEDQCRIVEKLDSAFAEIKSLKEQIEAKMNFSSALRQSLLSSAFTRAKVGF